MRTPGSNWPRGESTSSSAILEPAPEREELVVDELAVVEDPGLVRRIAVFVTVRVGHLAPVTRVREEQQIPLGERAGSLLNRSRHRLRGRLLRKHDRRVEAFALRDLLHVLRVELTRL